MARRRRENADEGTPEGVIPIFRPAISDEEIAAVVEVLRSGWIGSGPRVRQFEAAFAEAVGAAHAVSTCNGTSALLAAMWALGVGAGDEIILPSFTYISAFQVVRHLGATPVFADIEPEYLSLDAADVARRVTGRTKGILAVHHGGQLADMDALADVARGAGVWLVDDAAHAAGAAYKGRPVGGLCRATCFSFSAVKNLTTGTGGMVTTADADLAGRIAALRSLGIDRIAWQRYGKEAEHQQRRWSYQVSGEGLHLWMNDIPAAIGLIQLRRLPELNRRRAELAAAYEQVISGIPEWKSVKCRPDTTASWHMYTVLMDDRDAFVDRMRGHNICIGVHYYPIHLYGIARPYRSRLPVTEAMWQRVTTFPVYPTMSKSEQARVIEALLAARSTPAPRTAPSSPS